MYSKSEESYKKVSEEQTKALKVLNKIIRDKDREILELNKQMRHLRGILKSKKGV